MTRILFVIDNLRLGGAQEFLLSLVGALDRSRFELHVVSLSRDNPLKDELRATGVDYTLLGLRPGDPRAIWRIKRLIRRTRPHLVHAFLFASKTYGRIAAILSKVPGIVVHEVANDGAWKKWHHRFLDRILAPRTDQWIANADAVWRYYVTKEKVSPEKIRIVHTVPDLSRFDINLSQAECRARLIQNSNAPLIGTVARLHPQKRLDILLHAMHLMDCGGTPVRCLIVGSGREEFRLQKLSCLLGLEGKVFFLGPRRDLPVILRALDVYVNCSDYEGLPITLMQAMWMSRPVVATAVDGNTEIVLDGETGLLVPPAHPGKLADAMNLLLADELMAQKLGEKGRRVIAKSFSLEKSVREISSIYNSVLKQPDEDYAPRGNDSLSSKPILSP